jgi:hypothetical protein
VKWYKHLVDSSDDPDIDDAISLFGTDGYYVFFRTLEIMSREFDYKNPGKNRFSIEFFRKKFRISWRKTVKVLSFFHQKNRIFCNISNGDKLGRIDLYCPKLKELCDEHTRKIMSKNSGVTQELLRSYSPQEPEPEPEPDSLTTDGPSATDKIKKEIKRASGDLVVSCENQKYDFDVGKWVGSWLKKNGHPDAMIESMGHLTRRILDNTKPRLENPYGYIEHIMKRVNGNYWERASRKEAAILNSVQINAELKNMISQIGK